MKKLSIKINGITYVPKADTLEEMQKLVSYQSLKEGYDSLLKANIKLVDELEQKDIIIAAYDALNIQEFSNENSDLAERLQKAEAHIDELTNVIKSLEADLEALEELNNENDNTINELRNTLDDTEHVLARTH